MVEPGRIIACWDRDWKESYNLTNATDRPLHFSTQGKPHSGVTKLLYGSHMNTANYRSQDNNLIYMLNTLPIEALCSSM